MEEHSSLGEKGVRVPASRQASFLNGNEASLLVFIDFPFRQMCNTRVTTKETGAKLAGNGRPSLVDQWIFTFVLSAAATFILKLAGKEDLPTEIAVYGLGAGAILWLIFFVATFELFERTWMVALPLAAAAGVGIANLTLESIG